MLTIYIYNPWLGCHKLGKGCDNCFIFINNQKNQNDNFNVVRRNKSFDILLRKDKYGNYVIKSGGAVIICQKSDFFIEEADEWRDEVWQMIKKRKDLHFTILTRRIRRAEMTLPKDWGNGYANVCFTVSCSIEEEFLREIPYLLKLKANEKTIMFQPLLEEINLLKVLDHKSDIAYINCGGENYYNARPIYYDHILKLSKDSLALNIPFYFFDTGTYLIKDGKKYFIPPDKRYSQAFLSNLSHN